MPLSSKACQLNKINMIFFFPSEELQQKCKSFQVSVAKEITAGISILSVCSVFEAKLLNVESSLVLRHGCVDAVVIEVTWKYSQNLTLAKEKNPKTSTIADFFPKRLIFVIRSNNSVSCSSLRRI